MPPKKNKKVYNGFYMYMQEMMPQLKRRGYQFPGGMADVVPVCHPLWTELSEEERQVFECRAKQFKEKKKTEDKVFGRRDCTGQLISERVDPLVENEERRNEERQRVKKNWPKGEAVVLETFFMVDVQSLCTTELKETEMIRYLPCEIACVEYSLNAGIQRAWHKFIEPPPIPLGYRFQCKNESESTHQIPIQNFEPAESDYDMIWQKLLKFVNPLSNKEYPPLYCAMGDCAKVDWSLEWLAHKAGFQNKLNKVYELEGLVCDLFEHGGTPKPSKHMANELLTTSVFDYESDTRCPYHEELEVTYCSLGICKRYCFCLSDAFANIYNIDLTSAHLPEKPDGCPYRVVEPHELTLNVNRAQNRQASARPPPPPTEPHRASPNTTTTIVKPGNDSARIRYLESDFGPFSQPAPKPPQPPAGRGIAFPDSGRPLRRPYSVGVVAGLSGVKLPNEMGEEGVDTDWPTLGASAAMSRESRNDGVKPETRYAGGSGPPPASSAPPIPVEWSKTPSPSLRDLGSSLSSGTVRGNEPQTENPGLEYFGGYLGFGRGRGMTVGGYLDVGRGAGFSVSSEASQ